MSRRRVIMMILDEIIPDFEIKAIENGSGIIIEDGNSNQIVTNVNI
tara:strand:+ start:357 stop:494 length:138 start_codon:yes stop_codon:yes gene_type:complete